MSDLARLAASPCTDHAALALAVAVELGGTGGEWVPARLRALADGLGGEPDPAVQLTALGLLLAARLPPRPGGPLLLPDALARAAAHPATVAVAGAGVATSAGLEIGIVGHDDRFYLAHRRLGTPIVLDPADPARPFDARELGTDLLWRCAHETSLGVLDRIAARAEARLELPTALACAALRLRLPLDDEPRAAAAAEHQRLLAHFN